MNNRRKAMFFTALGGIMAVSSAITAADNSIRHIFIVAPLVVMGVMLFLAGYYAGLARR